MPFSDSIRHQAFAILETTFGTVPAFANSNAFLMTKAMSQPVFQDDERPDLAGSYDPPAPIPGDKTCTFSVEASIAPGGVAGTPLDVSPFLESGFGAKTISSGVSVTYASSLTLFPSVSMLTNDFPTSMDQVIGFGLVPDTINVKAGATFPMITFTGSGRAAVLKSQFASMATAAEKGQLSSFPAAPTSPVFNGLAIPKRRGSITIDGTVYDTPIDIDWTLKTGKSITQPAFGSNVGRDIQNVRRSSVIKITAYDDDSSTLTATKVKANTKARIPVILQLGIIAGSIFTINQPLGTLSEPEYGYDQGRKTVILTITGSESAPGAADMVNVVTT